MADNHNGSNPTRIDAGVPATTLQLVITMDQLTGQVQVSGPIQNSVVCFGMMKAAEFIINDFVKANQSRIIPGVAVMPSRGPA